MQLTHEFVHMLGQEYDDHRFQEKKALVGGKTDKPKPAYNADAIHELANYGDEYVQLKRWKGLWVSTGDAVNVLTAPDSIARFALRGTHPFLRLPLAFALA